MAVSGAGITEVPGHQMREKPAGVESGIVLEVGEHPFELGIHERLEPQGTLRPEDCQSRSCWRSLDATDGFCES